MQDIKNRFKTKLYECGKHVQKIEDAKEYLKEIMPLNYDYCKNKFRFVKNSEALA